MGEATKVKARPQGLRRHGIIIAMEADAEGLWARTGRIKSAEKG